MLLWYFKRIIAIYQNRKNLNFNILLIKFDQTHQTYEFIIQHQRDLTWLDQLMCCYGISRNSSQVNRMSELLTLGDCSQNLSNPSSMSICHPQPEKLYRIEYIDVPRWYFKELMQIHKDVRIVDCALFFIKLYQSPQTYEFIIEKHKGFTRFDPLMCCYGISEKSSKFIKNDNIMHFGWRFHKQLCFFVENSAGRAAPHRSPDWGCTKTVMFSKRQQKS